MADFESTYSAVVDAVYRFWTPEMQEDIARHNAGWRGEIHDFRNYLQRSVIRYRRVYDHLVHRVGEGATVIDLGGFWGVLPLTLARMGFTCAMTESLQYYGSAFDPLFDYINSEGVTIHDYDPFEDAGDVPGPADAVTAMAVLEHYPHSLAVFMRNSKAMLRAGGVLMGDVPNLAFWAWRVKLMRGRSPLVPLPIVFESEVPFTGHHREFTAVDLHDLASLSGFQLLDMDFFNYSADPWKLRHALRAPRAALATGVAHALHKRFPRTREIIFFSFEASQ